MSEQKRKQLFVFLTSESAAFFVALFFAVVLFHWKPVPFSDEFQYLLQFKKFAEPAFLANDWTFQGAGNEHWLFNQIFGFAAGVVSIEFIAWAGRIVCWLLLLAFLIRLGRFWQISFWQIGAAIFLWLAYGQIAVGSEWMIGGFQAKVVAYVCLLAALIGFCREKRTLPAILLGLTFSFHPSVGLWGSFGVGIALLLLRIAPADLLKVVVLTALFALPGVVPILGGQLNQAGSPDDWRFIVLVRYPGHLDPFKFSKTTTALLFLMLAFNLFALWRVKDFALKFLLYFQAATASFFVLGFALRFFELFEFLRFMPFRLFPLLTPLFFTFTAFYLFSQQKSKNSKILLALFSAFSICWLNPFYKTYGQIEENYRLWTNNSHDLQQALTWLAQNTPADSNVIQPPLNRETWYLSNRAQIASYHYPTYERLSEWRGRIADLTENKRISDSDHAYEEIEAAYNDLSPEQIAKIRAKYGATHLVSRAGYPYPVVFETKTYKVYQLR